MSVGADDSSFRLRLNQTAVDAAVAAMGSGIYDVCRREGASGAWTNTRIKIEMQSYMLGIELNSIASNNGLTGAIPRATTPPPILRCIPPGCPPGSTLAIIPSVLSTPYGVQGAPCSIVTVRIHIPSRKTCIAAEDDVAVASSPSHSGDKVSRCFLWSHRLGIDF